MIRLRLGAFFFALVLSFHVFANPPEPAAVIDLDDMQLSEFLHTFEQMVEGGGSEGIQAVLEKLNIIQFGRNLIRTYHYKKGREGEHAMNLVALFATSHGIETASGPLYFAYGTLAGHSSEIFWPTFSTLMSQALPGLDVTCFILGGLYGTSSEFRGVVRKTKLYVYKFSSVAAAWTGLKELVSWKDASFRLQDGLNRMQERKPNWLTEWKQEGDEWVLSLNGKSLMRLTLKPYYLTSQTREGEYFSLERVRFENLDRKDMELPFSQFSMVRWILKKELGAWGWDVKNVVLKAWDAVEAYGKNLRGFAFWKKWEVFHGIKKIIWEKTPDTFDVKESEELVMDGKDSYVDLELLSPAILVRPKQIRHWSKVPWVVAKLPWELGVNLGQASVRAVPKLWEFLTSEDTGNADYNWVKTPFIIAGQAIKNTFTEGIKKKKKKIYSCGRFLLRSALEVIPEEGYRKK